MFVARISKNTKAAVSLAFPMQQIMSAIGIGTGVGISASIPRRLARKQPERANELADTGIFLCLCYVAVFIVLGLTFAHRFYAMQTNVAEIVEGGTKTLQSFLVQNLWDELRVETNLSLTVTGGTRAPLLPANAVVRETNTYGTNTVTVFYRTE